MSDLVYKDDFTDLRYWTGEGVMNPVSFVSGPTSVDATLLISRRTFFDVQEMSIRFFDVEAATLGDFYLAFSLGGNEIFRVTSSGANYAIVENGNTTVSSVGRSAIWHEIVVTIAHNYQVSMDGTSIGSTTRRARLAFDVILSGGRWDDFALKREYTDDFQGGTGTIKDLMVEDTERVGEAIRYYLYPGYFSIDGIDYYHFANMGRETFTPNPSGVWALGSGIPYVLGQPYFLCDDNDIHSGSGYVRTPADRNYVVTWEPDGSGAYIPSCSGSYANNLVYEVGDFISVNMDEPIHNTHLVLTDEGGQAAKIRTSATYIESVKVGNRFGAYAEVTDIYGGPVPDAVVTWSRIGSDDLITSLGSSITNDNGIATIEFTVMEAENFHVYAETNPVSSPMWVSVPQSVAGIEGTIFQLDVSMLDSMEARCAIGHNIWAEEWGSNPGEATGLQPPYPTTHGQWEGLYPEQRRPPLDTDLITDEANGYWNARDFYTAYSGLFDTSIDLWVQDLYVARRGYWGTHLLSGADVRAETTIASGLIFNTTQVFEVERDYAATSGCYNDIMNHSLGDDDDYYVFYQMGSGWTAAANPTLSWGGINTPDESASGWCFHGIGLYDEDTTQGWTVEDLLSDAQIQE